MKKILFAVGGSGGHLFPAQKLAEQVHQKKREIALLFAGSGLDLSPYFDRSKFPFQSIVSASPFQGHGWQRLQTVATLTKGIRQAWRLLSKERPDLLIGFGSFHAFPLLAAATCKRIPLILFDSNAIPGKVVRLFAPFAKYTALYFSEATHHLRGKSYQVEMPSLSSRKRPLQTKAREYFGLDPDRLTLLVFGGSQGARGINQQILATLAQVKRSLPSFQLLHLTGHQEDAEKIRSLCQELDVHATVRIFETEMESAWAAADMAICRAGAATLAEMLFHHVPSILIPFPHAAEQHQWKNGCTIAEKIPGQQLLQEHDLDGDTLAIEIQKLAQPPFLKQQRERLKKVYEQEERANLADLLIEEVR